jgi:hypothetical protein
MSLYLLPFYVAAVTAFGLQLELDGPGFTVLDGLLEFQFGRIGAAAVIEVTHLLKLGRAGDALVDGLGPESQGLRREIDAAVAFLQSLSDLSQGVVPASHPFSPPCLRCRRGISLVWTIDGITISL